MKKITPDPPVSPLDAADSNDPLLDRAAIERALNYYLQGHKPHRPMGTALCAIPHSANSEAALAQASDLLRCAGACARFGVVGHAPGGAGQGLRRQVAGHAGNALKQHAPECSRRVNFLPLVVWNESTGKSPLT